MRPPSVLSRIPRHLSKIQKRQFGAAVARVAVAEIEDEAAIDATSNFNVTASSQKCNNCGKPVKPLQTVNANSRFLHCPECKSIFSTSSGADHLHKWNALKSNEAAARRPPYPTEVFLSSILSPRIF